MEHGTTSHQFSDADWDEYATCYDTLLELRPYQKVCAAVLDAISPQEGDSILDAGCGTGNLLSLMCAQKKQLRLYGIDLSASMLNRARKKLEWKDEVHLMQTSLDAALPFEDGYFNRVVSVNVLYAVPRPLHTLQEFFRVLKCGGTLVCVTPKRGYDNGLILKDHAESTLPDAYWKDPHQSREREELLLREALDDDRLIAAMQHIAQHNRRIAKSATFHFFTVEEIETVLRASGFSQVTIKPTYARQSFLVRAVKE